MEPSGRLEPITADDVVVEPATAADVLAALGLTDLPAAEQRAAISRRAETGTITLAWLMILVEAGVCSDEGVVVTMPSDEDIAEAAPGELLE